MEPVVFVAILAAVLGPLATYLVAVRKFSGKITDSTATELWTESRSIRQDLYDRNKFLQDSIGRLDERVLGLEKSNNELRQENIELRGEVRDLKDTIIELRAQVTQLLGEKEALQGRLDEGAK